MNHGRIASRTATMQRSRVSVIILLALTILTLAVFSSRAHAASANLAWTPPTTYTDGTPLTSIGGYKIHSGNASRSYSQTIDIGNQSSYTLNNLTDGATYYFAVSTYDQSGAESSLSNEISTTFPAAAVTWQITASYGTGGTIVPSGNVTVNSATSGGTTILTATVAQGGTASFAFTPNTGYRVYSVTVDGVSVGAVSSYSFSNVTANHSVSATFAPNTYTITASAGTGGTISPAGSSSVTHGTSKAFTITPATGYAISGVTVDGVAVGAVSSYTFSNVTAAHTIAAVFTAIPTTTYTITASAGTGGSISPAGAVSVAQGASRAFTITPATGFAISGVTVDGVAVGAVSSYTFSNVTAAHTIAAAFTAIPTTTYTITASAGTGGSISPAGAVSVVQGASRAFTITPAAGYAISGVTVDGVAVGAVSSYTFSNVTAAHTIAAAFTATPTTTYTITASAGTGGSISPAGAVSVAQGASRAFTITPATGYKISGISVDGVAVGAVSSYNFSNVSANHTIAATFAPITLSITASAGTGGSISPAGTATVTYGASQTYTITPASGYQVAGVTVDGVSVGAVATYTFSNVTAAHTISATFSAASVATSHWNDVTTNKTVGKNGTAKYMMFSPIVADATGMINTLRINIRSFGSKTSLQLALYDANGAKLTGGSVTATAAGYVSVSVPAVAVTKGVKYYIAAQAGSNLLYQFNCGASTGGFEAANTFTNGLPAKLPTSRWSDKLLTAGMYFQ